LKSYHEIFNNPARDCINVLLQVSPQEKRTLELDLETEEAMQSAPNLQSIFLDILCSTTAGHLPFSETEDRCAETATSAHSLEPIFKQPQQNTSKKITMLLSGQTFQGQTEAHSNVPDNSSPHADADLIHSQIA
jgi:hypothetical protein